MQPCVITVERTDDPMGVRAIAKTPAGALLCVTRVFKTGQAQSAREHAAWMADGLGYAELTRDAKIKLAHTTLAGLLLKDEQMSPEHRRDFDDSEAVVFSLLVPNLVRGIMLSEEVGPALLRAGFAAVSYGQPKPTPGTDGFTCEFAVTVGAP